jgi:hypothetical protein
MRWITALERRFGYLAIPGLLRIIVAFNALVYLLLVAKPEFKELLDLRPDRIMAGEVWRLVSFIFIPQISLGGQMSVLWEFVYLNLLWLMGEGLEQAWGSFKLNLFYLLGVIGTAAAAFILNATSANGVFLNLSLFFAFATLFPNYPVLVFFVLPVRVKWIALVSFALLLMQLAVPSVANRLAILVSLANYALFFGPDWVSYWRQHGKTALRQQQFQAAQQQEEEATLHHCKVCGRTEATSPDLDFRVAGDGEEYCLAHLPSRRGAEEMPPPLPR